MDDGLYDRSATLPSRLSRNRLFVRPVSQISLALPGSEGAFVSARTQILSWIQDRAGRRLPLSAWEGGSFELEDIGAQHAEAVSLDTNIQWAARLDDADREIPSRTWITEAGLAADVSAGTKLWVRLTVSTRGQDLPVGASVPGFVRHIVEKIGGVLDGRPLSSSPWIVKDRGDVGALAALIENLERTRDVIVFSLPEGSTDPTLTACSAGEVCRATLGAAHVAVITGPASFILSDLFGKEFSVFRQAVRTYRSDFDRNLDPLSAHPLTFAPKIAEWRGEGPKGFERFLIANALTRTVSGRDLGSTPPSFLAIKRRALEERVGRSREDKSTERELGELLEEENKELRRQLQEQSDKDSALVNMYSSDAETAREAADQERATNLALRARIDHLVARLASLPGGEATDVPHTLIDFEEWCDDNLAGRVELHSRAYQGIKKSLFEDVPLIYDALILLRDFYVPMRLKGGKNIMDRFRQRCADLGLDEQPTGTKVEAGHQGDEYFVRQGGRRCFLDRHLKKGSTRDERLCFRLYFFWDDEAEKVVVGWLPSHLSSRIT